MLCSKMQLELKYKVAERGIAYVRGEKLKN